LFDRLPEIPPIPLLLGVAGHGSGQMETVVVVARKGDQAIYYEDVEDGFNVSPVGRGWTDS
jgi:hypothetical protein